MRGADIVAVQVEDSDALVFAKCVRQLSGTNLVYERKD